MRRSEGTRGGEGRVLTTQAILTGTVLGLCLIFYLAFQGIAQAATCGSSPAHAPLGQQSTTCWYEEGLTAGETVEYQEGKTRQPYVYFWEAKSGNTYGPSARSGEWSGELVCEVEVSCSSEVTGFVGTLTPAQSRSPAEVRGNVNTEGKESELGEGAQAEYPIEPVVSSIIEGLQEALPYVFSVVGALVALGLAVAALRKWVHA